MPSRTHYSTRQAATWNLQPEIKEAVRRLAFTLNVTQCEIVERAVAMFDEHNNAKKAGK